MHPSVTVTLVILAVPVLLAQTPPTSSADPKAKLHQITSKASAGDARAQFQLGLAFASGDGVQQDEKKALEWFRLAADQGEADAEYAVGEMLLTGRGSLPDPREAFKWMERAARHNQGFAQANLGVLYLDRNGVTQDLVKGKYWLEKAASQNIAAAQFGLGSLYANGRGVPKNLIQAKHWYSAAAAQGDPSARNNLALLLATATSSDVRDVETAIEIARNLVLSYADVASFHDTLATTLFEGGKIDDAIAAEERALKLAPTNVAYAKALARFREASKRH